MSSLRLCFALASVSLAVACGGSSSGVDDPNAPPPGGSGEGSSGSSGATNPNNPGNPPGNPTNPTNPVTGPKVTIKMRGSTAPFAHADGFGGETPKKQIVAVRSLYLYRSPTDANPVLVFDHNANTVEAELITGKTTDIASVVAKTLPAGVFTMAKAGAAYVRYTVDARMHTPIAIDGQYDNVQALSDGAMIDGVSQKKGHFRYSFVSGGVTYGTLEGEDAPTPVVNSNGGLTMDMSGPQTFYVFPVNIAIDPNVTTDHEVLMELNVDKSFRWQDQPNLGYTKDVFDTTPTMFEPVMAFGANTFKLTLGPVAKQ
jgi:hypothetical protein